MPVSNRLNKPSPMMEIETEGGSPKPIPNRQREPTSLVGRTGFFGELDGTNPDSKVLWRIWISFGNRHPKDFFAYYTEDEVQIDENLDQEDMDDDRYDTEDQEHVDEVQVQDDEIQVEAQDDEIQVQEHVDQEELDKVQVQEYVNQENVDEGHYDTDEIQDYEFQVEEYVDQEDVNEGHYDTDDNQEYVDEEVVDEAAGKELMDCGLLNLFFCEPENKFHFLMIDVLRFTSEVCPPATIVVVTSNAEFAPFLCELKENGYNILVISSDDTSFAFKNAGLVLYDWIPVINGKGFFPLE